MKNKISNILNKLKKNKKVQIKRKKVKLFY